MTNFKKLRVETGLSQEAFRNKFNDLYGRTYTAAAISQFENNRRTPETGALLDFADFFGVSVDYLLGRPGAAPNLLTKKEGSPQQAVDLLSLLVRHDPAAVATLKNIKIDGYGSILKNGEQISNLSDPVLLAAAKMLVERLGAAQASGSSTASVEVTRHP